MQDHPPHRMDWLLRASRYDAPLDPRPAELGDLLEREYDRHPTQGRKPMSYDTTALPAKKPTLTSKTVLTALATAIFGALAATGVLPSELSDPQVLGSVATIGGLLAAIFRKKATAKLG